MIDKNGNEISSSNYSISYYGNCKSVGTHSVTVTLTGNYSGVLYDSFTIVPAETSISKLSAKSKGFKISIRKQNAQVSGYQVMYSTKKNLETEREKGIM